jgi:hypothetical protein
MKNKLMLTLILSMFLIGLVSAVDCGDNNLGTFKSGTEMSLRQTCDTCTYVTLSSITYPDSTTINIDENMTKTGIEYNYTFTNSSTTGGYYYSVFGDKDGTISTEVFCFEITPSGFVGTLGFYIIILILSLGIIILGYSIEDAWVVLLGGFGFILLGLFILLFGINGIKDSAYTYSFGIITIMLGAYFSIRSALEKMNEGL